MKFWKNKKHHIILNISKYMFLFVLVASISMPLFINASTIVNPPGGGTTIVNPPISTKIDNPLSDKINTIPKLIEVILQIVINIGVPIVVLAIIYSGFLFVTAQGNESKLKTAKSAIIFTLIGAALLLGSWVIANAIQGTINEIKSKA